MMKLPFLRALRHAYPAARITWLAGIGRSVYAGPLAGLVAPLLDEVIEHAGVGREWSELAKRPLVRREFDLVIDTQRRLKTTLILRRIRHERFISGCAGYRLSDAKPLWGAAKAPRMIDNMLALVEAASGKAANPAGRIVLDPALEERARQVLPDGMRYMALAPGAGGAHKRWPLERFIELARTLRDQGLTPVFLLGPAEAGWHGEVMSALPEALCPLQAPGMTASPLFTIALAARCEAAIANDSGTGHMIAAADIPLVSLFGPTDPAKFAPWVSRGAILRAQEFGGSEMEAIPVEAVKMAVSGLFRVPQ